MDKKFKAFVVGALVVLSLSTVVSTTIALDATKKYKEYDKKLKISSSVSYGNKSKLPIDTDDIAILPLKEPVTSNLGDSSGIVRLSISFGVDSSDKEFKAFSSQFTANEVRVRDEVIRIIRSQSYDNMVKPESQQLLAEEIMDSINVLMGTDLIKEVIFGEFFVQ